MAKLYFKYGAMGSSKTAQALITKYNYEENGLKVWLIKPSADTRDGEQILRSRIGLEAAVEVIPPETDIYARYLGIRELNCDVIIDYNNVFSIYHMFLSLHNVFRFLNGIKPINLFSNNYFTNFYLSFAI